MADNLQETTHTQVQAGSEPHVDPSFWGIDATMFVGLAMAFVLALMLWKRVPAAIGKALDGKIATIRRQLDEAAQLRSEAEALKAEYEARSARAESEAAATLDRAQSEATAIRAKAESDATSMVERRTRMAEDKIAGEERLAVQQLRAIAANAASRAAARLIAERHDGVADKALIDNAIVGLGQT